MKTLIFQENLIPPKRTAAGGAWGTERTRTREVLTNYREARQAVSDKGVPYSLPLKVCCWC